MKYYAGIGSRKTPVNVLHSMTNISLWLESHGYILRSGGAQGADSAFEKGVSHTIHKEIFMAYDATAEAMEIAKKFHPAWNRCSSYAKKLHARNAFQILGRDLKTPVEFVICWTPDGAETHEERCNETGGTGTAISIASANGIRVYNLANDESINELRYHLKMIKDKI